MSLISTVVSKLKTFAKVPVYVGTRDSMMTESILISPVKLEEMASMYETVYRFTHTVWRNMPTPPDCEPAFVIVWMISADAYDVNHTTVTWEGASANTFVHLWSTINRLRNTMDSMTAHWLLESRDAVGYVKEMNMPGAADTYLYQKEIIVPPHVGVLVTEFDRCVVTEVGGEFSSFYDFRQSMRMPKPARTIDVAAMMMRNLELATKRTTTEESR